MKAYITPDNTIQLVADTKTQVYPTETFENNLFMEGMSCDLDAAIQIEGLEEGEKACPIESTKEKDG